MSHGDRVLFGAVIVDNDCGGVECGRLEDFLLEGALSSLHDGHPVCGFRRHYKPGVWTAAL